MTLAMAMTLMAMAMAMAMSLDFSPLSLCYPLSLPLSLSLSLPLLARWHLTAQVDHPVVVNFPRMVVSTRMAVRNTAQVSHRVGHPLVTTEAAQVAHPVTTEQLVQAQVAQVE